MLVNPIAIISWLASIGFVPASALAAVICSIRASKGMTTNGEQSAFKYSHKLCSWNVTFDPEIASPIASDSNVKLACCKNGGIWKVGRPAVISPNEKQSKVLHDWQLKWDSLQFDTMSSYAG